jgi:hypothetical protein
MSRRRLAVLAAALAALASACVSGATPGPVFWPTNYASEQVYNHYANQGAYDATCAAVGPLARQRNTELFGEFACDVVMEESDYLLAVVPTSATQWKALKPGDVSPVSGPLQGIAGAGSPRRVGLVQVATHTILLDDNTTWKVVDKLNRIALWQTGDLVMIEPDQNRTHFYRIVNKSRGDDLEADFKGSASG